MMSARSRTRIGSDDARAWVRRLKLGNPYAKSVLMAVANYMNEDGAAWPGVATLAQDTDIAEDTVVGRLRWCESIGAVALFKNWVDENGVRNRDGRGRVTSHEIRFVFDTDPETICENAATQSKPRALRGAALASHASRSTDGDDDASPRPHGEQTEEISPRHCREQNSDSPGLAPDQPPPPAARREEEEEEESKKDSPPNPPQAGGGPVVDVELEADIDEFARGYPAPITNLPRLRTTLAAMSTPERRKVLLAVQGYANFIRGLERKGQRRAVKDAHRWVKNGEWQGYHAQGERVEAQSRMQQVATDSPEGRALIVLHRIAGMARPFETGGKFLLTEPMLPAVLALADAPDHREWKLVPAEDRNRCGAWNELVERALPGKNRPVLINTRNPGGASGFMAPWDWPPRKDGTLCDNEVRENDG